MIGIYLAARAANRSADAIAAGSLAILALVAVVMLIWPVAVALIVVSLLGHAYRRHHVRQHPEPRTSRQ